jgi:hypothetical protein
VNLIAHFIAHLIGNFVETDIGKHRMVIVVSPRQRIPAQQDRRIWIVLGLVGTRCRAFPEWGPAAAGPYRVQYGMGRDALLRVP